MAKGILEFDLNEPHDVMAHKRAVKATDMASVLFELLYNTKKGIKYSIDGAEMKGETISNYDAVDMVFEKIYEILDENNIDLDELIN